MTHLMSFCTGFALAFLCDRLYRWQQRRLSQKAATDAVATWLKNNPRWSRG